MVHNGFVATSASNDNEPAVAQTVLVTSARIDSTAVLRVSGEVDIVTAPQLEEAAEDALATTPSCLVLDLSQVGFLASAGLAVLVACRRLCGDGVRFRVVASSPATLRPIEMTGLHTEITVMSTLESALEA